MSDAAELRHYFAELSDADLAHSFAEGPQNFEPEAWALIEGQVAARKLETDDSSLIGEARLGIAAANSPRHPVDSDPFVRAGWTAYTMAACCTTIAASVAYGSASLAAGVGFSVFALLYAVAGVRIRRKRSARAVAIGMWLTGILAIGFFMLELRTPFTGAWWTMILLGPPFYWFLRGFKTAVKSREAARVAGDGTLTA